MKKKTWDVTVKDNPNKVVMGENDEFYTSDTEAYLIFNLQDKFFMPRTATLTLENRNDGSLKSEEVAVVDGVIEWEMPQRYIEHFGNWQGQLVYEDTKDGQPELYTSAPFTFVVNAHIGDKKKPSLVEIENWEKFIREGTELIETWEDMEDLRQANEAQRQANYQELLDTGVLQTNINNKLEQLEEEYAPKLTDVTAQLAQTATAIGNANSNVVTYDVDVFDTSMLQGKTSEQVVNEYFEPLRLANQTYIKRELLGKDATNTYDIYKYTLTPKNYSKTIFINTVLHGGEVTFLATMYELIKKLTDTEKSNNTYIEYLKNNVRIIFIPIANPWGFNQTHRTRWNGNGVNLARNSSFNWNNFTGTQPFEDNYKGTTPFSEKESQYIKEILDTETIDLYLDLHNTGAGTGLSYYAITEVDSLAWYPLNAILKELKEFNDLSGNIVIGRTNEPLMSSYGSSLGIYSTTLEVADGNFGAVYSDAEINKSMELLLSSIKNIFEFDDYRQRQDFNSDNLKNPVEIKQYYWNNSSTAITFNSSDWVELPQFRISYENEDRFNGFIEVDFDFVLKNDTEGAINYLVAQIEYGGTGGHGSAVFLPLGLNYDERYYEGNLRATLGVKATAYMAGGFYPIIKFYGKTTTGNVMVWRVRGTVKRTRTEKQQMSSINGTYKEENASGSVFIP